MISLAYMILLAVMAGFLTLVAAFLRLMVEDWEAVEIDLDEIEGLEQFFPTHLRGRQL